MPYLRRAVDQQLDQLLPYVGAVAIDGAKAVGKTETALQRSSSVLRLDSRDDRELLESNPTFSAFPEGTILIDEWQKKPESWDYVRRAVDAEKRKGRFLLTGSATPQVGVDTHSGAGRILSVRMRPMALFERPGAQPTVSLGQLIRVEGSTEKDVEITGETEWEFRDYMQAIAHSGFPELLSVPNTARNEQLDSYLRRIVDRDLPDQGYTVRNREGLLRWLTAYAAATATVTGYTQILDDATAGETNKPAKTTTAKYREKLEEIWMLDPLPAWNHRLHPLPGLVKSPKHHLADPAFVMRLIGITERSLLDEYHRTHIGPLFESLATLTVRVAAEAHFARVGHLKALKGEREVDLIVHGQDGEILPIEVKLASTVDSHDVRHLLWLKEKFPQEVVDMVVLTTGRRAYRRTDGVAVVPLSLLGL